jgi:hypothetical protein
MASGFPARRPGLPPTRPRLRGPQPSFGALGDQRPLELGDGTQEHAVWCGGVDRVAQAAEMRAFGFALLVAVRPGRSAICSTSSVPLLLG